MQRPFVPDVNAAFYPVHPQVCRVTKNTVAGPLNSRVTVYLSSTVQFQTSDLHPRDREPCYVLEPNGRTLLPGYYYCRLIGSYLDLPLYATMDHGGTGITTTSSWKIPAPVIAMQGSSSASPGGTVLIFLSDTTQLQVGQQITLTGTVATSTGTVTASVTGYVATIVGTPLSSALAITFQPIMLEGGDAFPIKPGDVVQPGAVLNMCCPVGTTSVTRDGFLIPVLGGTVTIPVTYSTWMIPGLDIAISDGINTIIGIINSTNPSSVPPTLTFTVSQVESGEVGKGLNMLATITPKPQPGKTTTTAPFTLPPKGTPVIFPVTSTLGIPDKGLFLIKDGVNLVVGFIDVMAPNLVQFVPVQFLQGVPGNVVPIQAILQPNVVPGLIGLVAPFSATTVGTLTTITLTNTDPLKTGDMVVIDDGTNKILGAVGIVSTTSVTFTPCYYYAGAPGAGVSKFAKVVPQDLTKDPLLGTPSPATNATAGFPYIPNMAGQPTGTPTIGSSGYPNGYAPMVFDSTNGKLWLYNHSTAAWTSWTTSAVTNFTEHVYTTSGTWSKPAGLDFITVECVGGGGGGGASAGGTSTAAAGGGGGGGGYSYKKIAAASLSSSESYAIGTGGTGSVGSNGTSGGTTSFGTSPFLSAAGGGGGIKMGAGSTPAFSAGGSGGTSSGGDLNGNGSNGLYGFRIDGSSCASGVGGNCSYFGVGGQSVLSSDTAGNSGTGYGAGGGGATSLTTNEAGGSGTDGIIVVREYYA